MRIEMKKFGTILTSRPAGREAANAIRAYIRPSATDEQIELDFAGVLAVGPSWLDEVYSFLKTEYQDKEIICLDRGNPSVIESLRAIAPK